MANAGRCGVRTQGLSVWAPNLFFVWGIWTYRRALTYRRAPGFPNFAHAESRLTRRAHNDCHAARWTCCQEGKYGEYQWNTRGCCAQAGYEGPLGRAADGHKGGKPYTWAWR